MNRALVYGVCAAMIVAAPIAGYAADKSSGDKSGKLASSDEKFMTQAARDGKAEVQLGRLAAERGSSDAVKKFGERMATDHGKANDELAQLAQQKGVTLPTDLGASDQRTYERLSNRSGADFDREYMKDMVRDHDKDVKAFEREAKNAKDPDLKAWAEKTVPVLHEHQQQAHQLQASVKDGKASARARSHESSPSASPPSERTK